MSRFRRLVPLLGSRRGIRLAVPGYLDPRLTLTRAQASGARSTALAADGVTWQEFAADVPRFNGAAQRLLIGGQRTNSVRNPRAEGSVTGSPGTLPTHWSGATGSFTRTVVGTGTEFGLPYVDLRFVGTSAQNVFLNFEGIVAASVGQAFTVSTLARVVAGSMTNLAPNWTVFERDSGLSIIATAGTTSFAIAAALSRPTITFAIGSAATAWLDAQFRLIAAGAYDVTLRLYTPQSELGAFASLPILPPVGTPGASTRGADLVSAPLSSLGIGANGACTVLGTFMLPQNAPAGLAQMLFEIDGGANSNRHAVQNTAAGAFIQSFRVTGGSLVAATMGTMAAGTAFGWGVSIDGAGRMGSCMNGGAVQVTTGGPTSGLTTLRLGADALGASNMHGEIGTLRALPYAVTDTELQRLVAELPA